MHRVKDGEVQELGILYQRYHAELFGYFQGMSRHRAISEDLVQDTFCRILKYRHSFGINGHFRAWMYQVGKNAHKDYFRKMGRETEFNIDDHLDLIETDSPDRVANQNDEHRLLQIALGQLSPEKREVLILSRFQDLKYDEIAEIIECDSGTVKVRVFRALRELHQIYMKMSGVKSYERET